LSKTDYEFRLSGSLSISDPPTPKAGLSSKLVVIELALDPGLKPGADVFSDTRDEPFKLTANDRVLST
jgi:hypothetical protein